MSKSLILKQTKVDKRNSLRFLPQFFITFKFVASDYSAVFIINKNGELVPFYKNLDGVFKDLNAFDYAFSAYDMRKGDDRSHSLEILIINPSYTKVIEAWKKLERILIEHSNERVLVTYLFSGHGLDFEGIQSVVVNEFDAAKKFYRINKAEDRIKKLALRYKNSFHMVIFSCCREVYSPNRKHRNGLPGPMSTAQAYLEARAKADEEKQTAELQYKSDLEAANAKIEGLT